MKLVMMMMMMMMMMIWPDNADKYMHKDTLVSVSHNIFKLM